ncbi:MAG: nucleotide exchange factor GrpE [Paraprevotella sp.]|nr:nucleotide exchange factor GrpE [Paraprevotella sp.]
MTEKENIKEENLKESEINEEIKSDETAQTPVDEAKTQEDEAANDNNEEEKRDPLTVALEEIENLKDKYLRSVAEFDNYRKRTLKEKAELILNGSEKAVQAFLPIIDDMERAIHSAEATDDIETVKEGMKLICQKTFKVMESLGVKKIDTADADFNTDFHEAVAMVPGMGDDKKGKILDCVQAGYTLNDKVIRHAKVAVGQ